MAEEQGESSGDKPFDATEQKLDRARKKGEIPRSADLFTVSGYLGVLLAAWIWGGPALDTSATALLPYIDHPEKIAPLVFGGGDASGLLFVTARQVVLPMMPGFIAPATFILAMAWVTRSFTVTPSRLMPRLNRISPVKGAARKFGRDGWFEFFKSTMKLIAVMLVAGWFIATRSESVLGLTGAEPRYAILAMFQLCLGFLAFAVMVNAVIAAIDWFWQRASHMRRNRMSHKELRDETKEAEGDPHLKSARRQKAQNIATNQMISKVAGSDVVIVNPTHFAVCLKWSRRPGQAPECVAKGADEIAAAIRKAAEASGVPVYQDAPTARVLFAETAIGEQIGTEHYRAVAAAIRFSEAMRQRARAAFL